MTQLDTAASMPKAKGWTEEELRQIKTNEMDEDKFADRVFEITEASPALVKGEQVKLIEDAIRSDACRRAALMLGTMSGAELCKKIEDDRDFAVAVADVSAQLKNAKERYESLANLLAGIEIRAMVALCGREDMVEILGEVQADC